MQSEIIEKKEKNPQIFKNEREVKHLAPEGGKIASLPRENRKFSEMTMDVI